MVENALAVTAYRPPELHIVGAHSYTPPDYATIELNLWDHFNWRAAIVEFNARLREKKPAYGAISLRQFKTLNHTARTYSQSLLIFWAYLKSRGYPFITAKLIKEYQAWLRKPCTRTIGPDGHLYRQPECIIRVRQNYPKGHILEVKTVNTYVSPVMIFIRMLSPKPIKLVMSSDSMLMFAIMQKNQAVQQAMGELAVAGRVKSLPPDVIDTRPNLEAHGKRLSQNALFAILEPLQNAKTLREKRDKAILLGFAFSGLRISSMQRLTIASISEAGGNTYKVNLVHKGRKLKEVAMDEIAVWAIWDYVQSYNAQTAGPNDPRYIGPNIPIWRQLSRWGSVYKTENRAAPMGHEGLRGIIQQRSSAAGFSINPHDLRRTLAKIGRDLGMDYAELSAQLCHATIDQTMIYTGKLENLARRNIANLPGFDLKTWLLSVSTN